MARDRFNLADHFVDRHVREGRGKRTAILTESRAWTYAEVLNLVNRAGNGLRALGVQPADRVVVVLPDTPEFAAAYFAAVKIGAVAVPTSTALRRDGYAHVLNESQARVLVVYASVWSEIEPALNGRNCKVVVAGAPQPGHLFWDDWIAAQAPDPDPAATSADDVAFWLWTSGSTGPPKAAVHRHGDWVHCCEHYGRGVLGITETDVTFSSSKLFHAYGLGNALLFPFYAGATTALYPGRPQARAVLECAERFRPSLFFSVPTLYAAMLAETDRENPFRLASVRLGVSAAEPLPAEIHRRWRERFGFEILDGIGSTEALHIYISSKPRRSRPGSTGELVTGYEVRITDEDGREVERGQIGDLWVRGESVAPCYWNRPELSQSRMRDGWFFSGDKYTQDADGYFWYAGRSDDMFRVSGQWVSPIEVEAALLEHPAVLESAVVAYKDEAGLVKPKAFVVLKPDRRPDPDVAAELQAFVKSRIAPYKYPRVVTFLAELPKTPTGKILRFQLR